ncbi:MAG: hypothetical protein ACOC33_03485 [bacterium]
MKKRKRYFAEDEEQAVIEYINTESKSKKNRLYEEVLKEPFRKMIQSILRKYPTYIGKYEMEEVEAYALTHLIDQMVKYKPFIIEYLRKDGEDDKWVKMNDDSRFIFYEDAIEKLKLLNDNDDNVEYRIFNSKAFSYCQTIVRNYFKDWGKRNYSDTKTNLNFEEYVDEINDRTEYLYEMEEGDEHVLEKLINVIVDRINDKIENDPNVKENEIIVGDAIINVLKNWHVLFTEESPNGNYNKKVTNKFAKNKILLLLKEQTDLSTKEIRAAIKPFKDIYFFEKNEFFNS